MAGPKECITIPEVASKLGVSERHVYTLLASGHLEAFDISSSGRRLAQSLRVSISSITEFMESRRVKPEDLFFDQ